MDIIRAKGIPLWVTILAILIGLGGTFLGLRALFDPTTAMGFVEGAEALGTTWGGRNAGLGIALLIAVFLRGANAYVVAFAASLFREVSDIMASMAGEGGLAVGLVVFLLIELVCLVISFRASRQQEPV